VNVRNLAVDASDGPAIAGSFSGPVDFGGGSASVPSSGGAAFVAHYASDKTHVWSRIFDAPYAGVDGFVAASFVAGSFNVPFSFGAGTSSISPSGGNDVFLARFSDFGAGLWSRGFGDPGDQYLDAVALTPQGAPVLVGVTSSGIDFGTGLLKPTNAQAIFVAKLTQ
jgi:hypothetical protein